MCPISDPPPHLLMLEPDLFEGNERVGEAGLPLEYGGVGALGRVVRWR